MPPVLRFDRPGARFQVPEVTVPLNQGWSLKDAGHRAIVDFGELRINGATLTDANLQKALRAVVFAAAAYSEAGEECDALVRAETRDERVKIFSSDPDERASIGRRRELEKAVSTAELLLVFVSDLFLSLYRGKELEGEALTCLSAFAETYLRTDSGRDFLVS